jgi:hypothetical protein
MTKTNVDIVLLSETKLKPATQLKFRNYHVYRSDNTSGLRGQACGGTAALVHRRIVHRHIIIPTTLSSTTVEIAMDKYLIQISAVYKSPKQQIKIDDLNALTNGNHWFVVAGDLNAKHPLWHSRCSNAAGAVLYNHALNDDYTVTAPDSPTFYPAVMGHRPDVLDIALIRLPQLSYNIKNINDLSSDHNPVLLTLSDSPITSSPPQNSRCVNWSKYIAIIDSLSQPSIQPIRTSQDIDAALNLFTANITTAVNNSTYTRNNRTFKSDLPPEIAKEIEIKNRLRREWQRSRDPLVKRRLNCKIKFIRLILKTHRADEWDRFLDTLDAQDGSIYKLNKKLLNKTPAVHPLIGPNGLMYKDVDKAELFADTFEHQFMPTTGPDIPAVNTFIHSLRSPSQAACYTTPGTVQKIINQIPKRKAPGADSITNIAIKLLPRKTVLLLTHLINGCLRIGYFPTSWKHAIIITIPKPGKDHRHPVNYRPIALLSSLSKIFERVILKKLNAAIGPKIRNEQFAFRPQHSTTHQLVGLVDQLASNSNSKLRTAAVFLDVEKAFDRVWHAGLLYKLHILGTHTSLLNIIKSFLTDRSFSVKLNTTLSSSRPVLSGVPQGSCLSPTLYLAYTNDVPLNQNARLYLFADDTMFTASNKNPKRAAIQLQKQLNETLTWCKKWRLNINAQKTVAVMFNGPNNFASHHLNLNGHQIPWSPTSKYLGVTIDRNLTFSAHIKETVKKATAVRGMLYPILNRSSPIPIKTKLNILQLYIKPILSYAGPAWGPLISKANWRKLEAVQNISLRTITSSPWFVTNKIILSSTRTSTIKQSVITNSKNLFHRNSISTFAHIRSLGQSTLATDPASKPTKRRPLLWSNSN